jgi:hypothetical protein
MGTVIYSANPAQAFLGTLAAVAVLGLVGLLGIGTAVFRRNQGRTARILSGGLGALLLIAGCAVALITLGTVVGGSQTMAVRFDNKSVAQDSCGDNGETCARYVLSATTRAGAVDFDVPQAAYEQAQLHVCYNISFYGNKGGSSPGSYQLINSVTRIETADPSACQ